MDRSKSTSNNKDIVCGSAFEPIDVLQELSRLRRVPVDIIKNKQEDAHELLCQLLSEIHDEICQILYKSSANKPGKVIKNISFSTFFLIFFRRTHINLRYFNTNIRRTNKCG